MSLTVGSRLAHYDVTALIGEGGMGQVYQATDTKLNRQVALNRGWPRFRGGWDRFVGMRPSLTQVSLAGRSS